MYYDTIASGYRIQNLRKQKRLTQEALADDLRISHSMMSKIESGTKGVSIDLAIEIAAYFNVTLDFIILGSTPSTQMLKEEIQALITQLASLEKLL